MSTSEAKRICTAFEKAFSSDELQRLVRLELDINLEFVVSKEKRQPDIVFELVTWAERNNSLGLLLAAAAKARPHSLELQAVAAEYNGWTHVRADLSECLQVPINPGARFESTLIAWLMDRIPQTSELGKTIAELPLPRTPQPIVLLVHGSEEECPEMFIKRIIWYELKRLLPEFTTYPPRPIRLWLLPPSYQSPVELHEDLRIQLGKELELGARPSLAEINNCIANRRGPTVIHTPMSVSNWSQRYHQLIYDYMSFWNEWPDLSAHQWLFVIVGVNFQTKSKGLLSIFHRKRGESALDGSFKLLLTALEHAHVGAASFDRIRCKSLSQLEPIRREDAINWASDLYVQKVVAGGDLVALVRSVYDRRRQSAIPMATLYDLLSKEFGQLWVGEISQ